ncbi:ClpXP protease specificity-enhancing factor [Candidatus Spongiihabitans sp.]|uniref:ClpXP protease specificity-enhancing factor n=1 Tax=Candidatus Spongiihabitans sp. TaxID=3101308 RepID=UPI003C6FA2AD
MAGNSSGGKQQNPSLTTKPYLMRAIYEWALDNGFTPQVLIATDRSDVVVPKQYVKDNQIILNIHPQSVSGLDLGDELLWCSTRFSGKPMEITAPVSAVLAIYARENGQGIVFQDDDNGITPPTNTLPEPPKASSKKKSQLQSKAKIPDTKQSTPTHLKIVK